jgi:hypothetical protein
MHGYWYNYEHEHTKHGWSQALQNLNQYSKFANVEP